MTDDEGQGLRMFVAQNLRKQLGADRFQLAEGRGAGIETQGIHHVLGGFGIKILDQQAFQRIAAARDHVHTFNQRFVELAQNLFNNFARHWLQFHNGSGDVGYFLPVHAFEHVSRKFVAHGEQQHGSTLFAGQLHLPTPSPWPHRPAGLLIPCLQASA